MNAFFFGATAMEYQMSKIRENIMAETLSNVTNSSILENPQFGCCGYCDNFCDWWI